MPIADGPAPCDACRFRQRCAAKLLACRRYVRYVDLGLSGDITAPEGSPFRWNPNLPSRRGYVEAYPRDERRNIKKPEVTEPTARQKRISFLASKEDRRRSRILKELAEAALRRWESANRRQFKRFFKGRPEWAL